MYVYVTYILPCDVEGHYCLKAVMKEVVVAILGSSTVNVHCVYQYVYMCMSNVILDITFWYSNSLANSEHRAVTYSFNKHNLSYANV